MRDLRLGRWRGPTIFDDISEAVGGTLEAAGAGVVAGEARPRPLRLTLPIHGTTDEGAGYYEAGLRMRRQLRALLENDAARLQGLYFAFTPDPELNGWVLAAGGDIEYADGGITLGQFKLSFEAIYRVATPRTHRPARRIDLADRRLSTTPRDYLGRLYSVDFASQAALALNFLPVAVSDVLGTGRAVLAPLVRATLKGNVSYLVGRPAGETASFEQAEADHGKSDVVAYDRRSSLGYGEAVRAVGVPLGYWPLAEASGTTAADVSGNSRNGTYAGGVAFLQQGATGDGSTAVLLDGVDDRITTTYNPFTPSSTRTFGGWAYRRTNTTADCLIGSDAASNHVRLRCVAGTNDLEYTNNNTAQGATWAGVVPLAAWFHWLVVYNDSNRSATLYINGVSQGTQTLVGSTSGFQAAPGNIAFGGRGTSGLSDPFDGYLAHVAVWSAALTQDHATSLYTAGRPAMTDPQDAWGWEELYGPDQREPMTTDIPVLENGLCRVRWIDAAKSLAVDSFDAARGSWLERGRVTVWRDYPAQTLQQYGGTGMGTFNGIRSDIAEWTPECAVVRVSFDHRFASDGARNRVEVYITLGRGWTGPRIEAYGSWSSHYSATLKPGVEIRWSPFDAGAAFYLINNFLISSTDGWLQPNGGDFTGIEPWVALQPTAAGQPMVVLAALQSVVRRGNRYDDTAAYGSTRKAVAFTARYGEAAAGYVSATFGVGTAAVSNEAESFRNTGSATTSQQPDAAASGGQAVEESQAAETNRTLHTLGSTVPFGKVAVFARARVLNAGATATLVARATGGQSTFSTTTSTTFAWIYLGELTKTSSSDDFWVNAYRSAGTGNIRIDQVVYLPLERRVVGNEGYDGARDFAQANLYDARSVPELIER